jgi:hemoglobin
LQGARVNAQPSQGKGTGMTQSLYERLGGANRIAAIVDDVFDLHMANPLIKARFEKVDLTKLKRNATDFFCMGSGGPQAYQGKDMLAAHKGLNISEQEFIAALDDILAALDRNKIAPADKSEVLSILYSMKNDVIRV